MKILFCTNTFQTIRNGPTKFARLLLRINKLYPQHEIKILTEDVQASEENVFKLKMHIPKIFHYTGSFIRMYKYHNQAMKIKDDSFDFEILVYNNLIFGLLSGLLYSNTIGFVNDDNNCSFSCWKNLFRLKFKKAFIFKPVEYVAVKLFKRVVVNSQYLKNELIIHYKISPSKISLLYKGIDIYPIEKNNFKLYEPYKILFVKNNFKLGGFFVLLDALSKLPYKFLLTAAFNYIGHEGNINSLVSPNVSLNLKGLISQPEVFKEMGKADILCIPSYREALGVANLEGLACGCCVVTTNVGGIYEAVGECGWLVEPGNAYKLANAINDCISNEKLRKQKHELAKKQLEKFRIENTLSHFIKMIENI